MIASENGHPADVSQVDRFKQAARDLECDEDEARWNTTLKKAAKQKPDTEKGAG